LKAIKTIKNNTEVIVYETKEYYIVMPAKIKLNESKNKYLIDVDTSTYKYIFKNDVDVNYMPIEPPGLKW